MRLVKGKLITHSGGGGGAGPDRGRMHPDTGSPHFFLFCLSLSFPVRASHCGKLACICRRGHLRSTSVTRRGPRLDRGPAHAEAHGEAPAFKDSSGQGTLLTIRPSGGWVVKLCARLMRASTADVRDPAAEMTSLSSLLSSSSHGART